MDLKSFRTQYPQYDNIPDQELVTALHNKFYSQMPLEEFSSKIGYTPATQEPKEDDSSDFMRGFKSWLPQTKQLIGGTEVLAGKAFNAPSLIEAGAEKMKSADTEIKTKPSDSFTEAWKQGIGTVATDWLPYQAGAGVSNILEIVASSALGGVAGSILGPEGTAGGAIAGAVERKLVKKGIMEKAEKIIDEQAKKAFLDKEAKKQLIELYEKKGICLEGNIIRMIESTDDEQFKKYLDDCGNKDKENRKKRLDITKQIQTQNKVCLIILIETI